MAKVVIDIPKNIWERVKDQKCTIEDIRMSLGAVAHGKLLDDIKKDSSATYIIEPAPNVTCDKMCCNCVYSIYYSIDGKHNTKKCAMSCDMNDPRECTWYTPSTKVLGGNDNGRSGND